MRSRLVLLLLGLSLLLNTFVLVGFVYRSWIAPPDFHAGMPPPPPPPGAPRPSPVELLAHDLKLDESQRKALKGVLDQYSAARRERMQEIQRLRELTAVELRGPDFDTPKIESLVDQVSRLRAEQQKESLRTMAQFGPALRPDQRDRMHALLADRYANALPPRPRHPGGPPPGGAPPRPPQ